MTHTHTNTPEASPHLKLISGLWTFVQMHLNNSWVKRTMAYNRLRYREKRAFFYFCPKPDIFRKPERSPEERCLPS